MERGTKTPVRRLPRHGIAMMLVLGVGLVVLALGMAMITTSGGLLGASADSKQKIRARYAAESAISVSIADAVNQAGEFFGGNLDVRDRTIQLERERGEAEITSGPTMGQETITTGSSMRGLRGFKIPLRIDATGKSAGGAPVQVAADVFLYQVPVFQFGVFYEGALEITPGPEMFVMGRVHTNADALFRGNNLLTFQGPVTVAGRIWQWRRSTGSIQYRVKPDTLLANGLYAPTLQTSLTAMTSTTQPPPVGGVANVRYQSNRLILPIGGGTPRNLILPRQDADPEALRRQKFDWVVKNRAGDSARFVAGVTPRPSWITGPRVFWDRREDRWVKVWDFDIARLSASTNRDSLFYLADTTVRQDKGKLRQNVLNAFRIVNGSALPRNLTIASNNPVYIQGNFNLANPAGSCRPAGSGTVHDSLKYCNAQIASDAVTLLSPSWPTRDRASVGNAGTLEQAWDTLSTANWYPYSGTEPTTGQAGSYTSGTVRVQAAIFTGNLPSASNALPPANTTETTFENRYEGGWHNTIRFLENWGGATTVFKGSFICMYAAATPGLKPTSTSPVISTGSHYSPPVRVWGYDPRFDDLSNMPPGTPFLATAILTNWLERR